MLVYIEMLRTQATKYYEYVQIFEIYEKINNAFLHAIHLEFESQIVTN